MLIKKTCLKSSITRQRQVFGDGENRTPVRKCNPSTSTSLVMRGNCREQFALAA